jgi:hydroxyacylglutathione hydrolase
MAPSPAPIGVFVTPVTPLQQNCTTVWCTATKKAAVIDAGGGLDAVLGEIARRELVLEQIWITHGHVDHAAEAASLRDRTGLAITGPHRADEFLLQHQETQGQMFGIVGARSFTPDRWLEDGDRLSLGETEWEVFHAPGHSPGHVVFFNRAARFAQVGDVLFAGSIGRTDLPGGDMATLVQSVRDKLWPLGADVTFVPGHGPASTLGEERRSNPFVSDAALER